jgi:3-hydroxyisobutyrate dehydrogenase
LGIHSIDAPVSGGDIGAKNGCLVTMCGGNKEHIESVKPLLDLYSV